MYQHQGSELVQFHGTTYVKVPRIKRGVVVGWDFFIPNGGGWRFFLPVGYENTRQTALLTPTITRQLPPQFPAIREQGFPVQDYQYQAPQASGRTRRFTYQRRKRLSLPIAVVAVCTILVVLAVGMFSVGTFGTSSDPYSCETPFFEQISLSGKTLDTPWGTLKEVCGSQRTIDGVTLQYAHIQCNGINITESLPLDPSYLEIHVDPSSLQCKGGSSGPFFNVWPGTSGWNKTPDGYYFYPCDTLGKRTPGWQKKAHQG